MPEVRRAGKREQHGRAHFDPLARVRVQGRELAVTPEATPTLFEPLDLRERPRLETRRRVAEHHMRGASHCTRPAFGPVAVSARFGQGHFEPVHAGGAGGGGGGGGV